jgi:spermidine synthase
MTVDLVTLAQTCDTAEAFEAGVLEALGRRIGFDAGFFMVKGNEHSVTMVGLDAATRARAIARSNTYAKELAPVKRAALAARGVAVDSEVCGLRAVQSTCYYREIASTVAGTHTLMAYVPWRGQIAAALMLGRSGNGFSAGEKAQIESLLPLLGVARASLGMPRNHAPLPGAPGVSGISLLQKLGLRRNRTLASVSTATARLTVRDRGGFREMVARDGETELIWTRAALGDVTRSGWPYVDLFHLAPAIARQRQRALFIGCGGAVSVRQFAASYPTLALELVEREPAVVDLARQWFGLDAVVNLKVHIADGVEFVRHAAQGSWDIIVIDAYDAANFASDFADPDFLDCLRVALRRGGALACNVIGTLAGDGPVHTFVAAARRVFDSVRMHPVVDLDETFSGDALRNVVVVASRGD